MWKKICCGLWGIFLVVGGLFAQEEIPDSISMAYHQGIQLMTANQFGKALPFIFECQRTDPLNHDFLNRLGYCYYKLGNYRDAKFAYDALLNVDSLNISGHSNLAIIAEQELNYNKALRHYERLLEIDSANGYYYRQNALLLRKTGNLIGAVTLFNKAHFLNEKDIATICDLAAGYLSLDALDYADQMIKKGLQLDANNIRLLQIAARFQNEKENYLDVIQTLRQSRQLGDSTIYYTIMLSVAYLKVDSLDHCIDLLQQVVALKKDGEHTHHYLGLAYEKKNDIEKAIQHFNLAVEHGISPKVARYHQDLAELYERSDKCNKAYDHYRKAQDYKPKDEILFHIAHNADKYFKDKNIALRYYKKYLKTENKKYKAYANQRALQLKEGMHLKKTNN